MTKQNEQNQSEYSLDNYIDSIGYEFSPFEELALEVINERLYLDLSQNALAKRMKTKQSVVSRFENLGRSPSLKWLSRMAEALGTRFKATIHGDFMFVVPREFRSSVNARAQISGKPVNKYINDELIDFFEQEYKVVDWNPMVSEYLDEKCLELKFQGFYLSSDYRDLQQHTSTQAEQDQTLGCA